MSFLLSLQDRESSNDRLCKIEEPSLFFIACFDVFVYFRLKPDYLFMIIRVADSRSLRNVGIPRVNQTRFNHALTPLLVRYNLVFTGKYLPITYQAGTGMDAGYLYVCSNYRAFRAHRRLMQLVYVASYRAGLRKKKGDHWGIMKGS